MLASEDGVCVGEATFLGRGRDSESKAVEAVILPHLDDIPADMVGKGEQNRQSYPSLLMEASDTCHVFLMVTRESSSHTTSTA